jgi:hypothetical protein
MTQRKQKLRGVLAVNFMHIALRQRGRETMSSAAPATEIAKNVLILIAAGIAIIIGMVVLVYMITVIMDRYCGGGLAPDAVHQIDHGPVARKAGLWGLRQDERRVILERVLIEKPYSPEILESHDNNADVENPPPKGELLTIDTVETNDTQHEEAQDETSRVVANTEELDDAQHDTTCAICLSEYVQGEMVVSGTSCSHFFHKTCSFAWLEKHDHCPYCRKEMMTPSEMRSTAEDVLGEQRILQMQMWGPTIELARNDFEDDPSGQVANATPATAVELTPSAVTAGPVSPLV